MSTPLSQILELVDILKSNETIFATTDIPIKFVKWGVIRAGIALGLNYDVTLITDSDGVAIDGYISEDMTDSEKYLAGMYAYRNFALNEHHRLASKAVNFKTINFAVTGLTERSKEIIRIVWWCDSEITKVLSDINPPMGYSDEMEY